ncbi:hypothetical protein [Flavobacterium sp. ov086]|uniref:hypothetical protein n=1 Tax=Flavobacterium sp. ov086 TaxID=1761785 RepID=UPI000B6FBE88|nr:hypothetical protein [Flavobacterium sp. ov086]SNR74078.1 hypothetical protein SAMN04487979_11936 [Flavobacterium sp. ov086]
MEVLAECTAKAMIHCAAKKIDITDWLFTLKDQEYQSCSVGHIAGGISTSIEGKKMSINVEKVADNLLVQHYIEEIGNKAHCRVNSVSDSFSGLGSTKLGIIWELKINVLTADTCELENRVVISSTDEFLALLKSMNITDLTLVKSQMLKNVEEHNAEETPLFAADIYNKVLVGRWD